MSLPFPQTKYEYTLRLTQLYAARKSYRVDGMKISFRETTGIDPPHSALLKLHVTLRAMKVVCGGRRELVDEGGCDGSDENEEYGKDAPGEGMLIFTNASKNIFGGRVNCFQKKVFLKKIWL